MKNRYGADGMTYPVDINTENGNIEIKEKELDESQLSTEGSPNSGGRNISTGFSAEERNYLQQRFFELEK